jgi:excisionase family DNA binding protein
MARHLLSSAEIAEANGVTAETMRRLYRAGRIPAYRVGRLLKFDPDEVRAAFRQGARPVNTLSAEPNFDALDAA